MAVRVWLGLGLCALLCAPLMVAPIALNLVDLAILNPGSVPDPARDAAVAIARASAWGPFVARVANAEAWLAHQRGDSAAELALLSDAAAAAPTDPSLAVRLAELRMAAGDRDGVIRALRANHVLANIPLSRGLAIASLSPTQALDWFGIAQAVDPNDPRPYLETSRLLLGLHQPDRAAPFLSQALLRGGRDPVLAGLARRLVDPFAALDAPGAPPSPTAMGLIFQASQVMSARGDVLGAVYADEVALQAEPSDPTLRSDLARLRQRLGVAG